MINAISNPLTFTVPLSYDAHSIAQQCREGIANPDKSKQVYLNSLAVYAVNYYLQNMGFETDWEKSDSRDPIGVKLANIADLSLKNLGKVECCYILPDADNFDIAPEVREERIAYVAVKLTESLKKATILGYIKTPQSTVFLNQLQSLEDLLLYLSTLEVEALSLSDIETSSLSPLETANTSDTVPISNVAATRTSQTTINPQQDDASPLVSLGNWLNGVIEEGWQRVEDMFGSQQLGLAFMNEVSVIRAQELDLGIQLNEIAIALVTKVTNSSTNTSEVDVLMQIRPMKETALPAGITLQIQDTSGETVLETTSREGDNWIQLGFDAEYEETFQVVVSYQDAVLTKPFMI